MKVYIEIFCWSSYLCLYARVISSWGCFKQSHPVSGM